MQLSVSKVHTMISNFSELLEWHKQW